MTTHDVTAQPADLVVVSPEEAWFAAQEGGDMVGDPLLMHWSGLRWTPEPFPVPRDSIDTWAHGLAVRSPSEVWAVGSWRGAVGPTHPLVARWSGERWARIVLGLGSLRGGLSAATAPPASTAVWAVGSTDAGPTGSPPERTLVLRWNDTRWHRIPSPSPGRASRFSDVVVVDGVLWAVGSYEPRHGATRTLAARYRAGEWSVFRGRRGSLQAVDAARADLVWAVGPGKDVAPQRAFVMRWDGRVWKTVTLLGDGSALQDVVVASPTDAWAVGYRGGLHDRRDPLVLRRSGTRWRWARPPEGGGALWEIDGTPHNLWALSVAKTDDGWDGDPPLDTFHRC